MKHHDAPIKHDAPIAHHDALIIPCDGRLQTCTVSNNFASGEVNC